MNAPILMCRCGNPIPWDRMSRYQPPRPVPAGCRTVRPIRCRPDCDGIRRAA